MNKPMEYEAEITFRFSWRKLKLKRVVEDGFTDSGARFFVNGDGEYMEIYNIRSLKFSRARAEAVKMARKIMNQKNPNP